MRYLTLFLAICVVALGAPYAPGSRNLIDWTPNTTNGVGIPGGIPARATIYQTLTPSGTTADRKADIEAALTAAPSGQTVFLSPGVYYIDGLYLAASAVSGKTLRGPGAILRFSGTQGINFVGSDTYNSTNTGSVVRGDASYPVAKGVSTLKVTNPGLLTPGKMVIFRIENDPTLPIMSVGGYKNLKAQLCVLETVDTDTGVITFSPALYQDYVEYVGEAPLDVTWGATNAGAEVTGFGIEDVVLDNSSGNAGRLLYFSGAQRSWVKNVTFKGIKNVGLGMVEATQMEVRDCYFDASKDPLWLGTNHAGFYVSNVSASLIENNTFYRNFPLFESQNGVLSGSVFAFNFGISTEGYQTLVASHGGGNFCNLWEGNGMQGYAVDGYFGGATEDTLYRNYFHGRIHNSVSLSYPITLARFTRLFELVGNLIGEGDAGISFGNASSYGAGNTGEANNLAGDPWVDLTLVGPIVKVDDTTFTITVPDASLVTVGQWPINVGWDAQTVGGSPVAEGLRYPMHVLAVNTTTDVITVGNSTQNNPIEGNSPAIPPTGTIVQLYTGTSGYAEMDLAVEATTTLLGNNYSMYGYTIPAAEALGSTTLPNSLFRSSAPSFFSGYGWPAYDPVANVRTFERIPAGARFIEENPPRITGASIAESGNTVFLNFDEAVTVGAGGAGVTFTSTPSGGAVALTYDSGSSTSTSLAFTTSRSIGSDETGLTLQHVQPGNGIQDADGNEAWTFYDITPSNNSAYTPGATWYSGVTAAASNSTEYYGAYAGYATKVNLPVSKVIDQLSFTFAAVDSVLSVNVGLFSADGSIFYGGGVATTSVSTTQKRFTVSITPVALTAADYLVAIYYNSNGGTGVSMYALTGQPNGTSFAFVPSAGDWPLNPTAPLMASGRILSPKSYTFSLRALDDGTPTVATPTFSPSTPTHSAPISVTITSAAGSTTYYTLNGTAPTTSSTLYTGPISIGYGTTTLKAYSIKAEENDSAVRTATYVITAPGGGGGTVNVTTLNVGTLVIQ